jgi:hypothetical protein
VFKTPLYICALLFVTASAFAQDATTTGNAADSRASFVVQLTEYQLEQPIDQSLSAAAILEMLTTQRDGEKCRPVETIRLSTVSGTESMAQFGRVVNVIVGKATTARGETLRNMQAVDIGSMIRVTAIPQDERVAITLNFETSRISGDIDQDVPPSISKTQISTTQLLELGKPTLVGSSTTTSSSIFVVTVTRH